MDVIVNRNENELNVALVGQLDAVSAPELEKKLDTALADVTKLILDLKGLDYISSAGLRVMLTTMRKMDEQGEMIVKNVRPQVMDIFEMTGFAEDLTFEQD